MNGVPVPNPGVGASSLGAYSPHNYDSGCEGLRLTITDRDIELEADSLNWILRMTIDLGVKALPLTITSRDIER